MCSADKINLIHSPILDFTFFHYILTLDHDMRPLSHEHKGYMPYVTLFLMIIYVEKRKTLKGLVSYFTFGGGYCMNNKYIVNRFVRIVLMLFW